MRTGYIFKPLSIFFIAFAVVMVCMNFEQRIMAMNFERQKWIDTKVYYDEPYIRIKMVDDLVTNHLSKGISRLQVIELLGEQTETKKMQEYDLVYWLGMEKSFISIDSLWLVIKFDKEDRLTEFKILTD